MRASILAITAAALGAVAGCSGPGADASLSTLPIESPAISVASASAVPTPLRVQSSTASPGASTVGVVFDAASGLAAAGTIRFHLRVEITGGSAKPMVQLADGAIVMREPRRSTLRISSETGVAGAEMIHDSDAIYLRGPGFENQTGPGKWLKVDLTSKDPRMAEPIRIFAHSLDPRQSVYLLFGATVVEARGTEVIDGRDTSAFHVAIDMRVARTRAPDDVGAILQVVIDELDAAGWRLDTEAMVWIDIEGRLRRMEYTLQSGSATPPQTAKTSVDVLAFGEPLELAIPTADEVVLYGTPRD